MSQVGEDVYKDKALLTLDCLSNKFLQSCIQCAAYFAGVQQQVSTWRPAFYSFNRHYDQHQLYDPNSCCCEIASVQASHAFAKQPIAVLLPSGCDLDPGCHCYNCLEVLQGWVVNLLLLHTKHIIHVSLNTDSYTAGHLML